MKTILLLIHDDDGQEARFQAALDVTRALGGHLKCLDVTCMSVIPGDGFGSEASALMLKSEIDQEAANKARMQQRLSVEDVSWDWQDVTGFAEKSIEDAAGLSDLIVVNRQLDDYPVPDMLRLAAGLIKKSGKPVLAVPADAKGFRATGSALVAWDGSNEASAALTAAVPLLAIAASVTIVQVEDGSIGAPAEEAAAYLSRHDIHPIVVKARPDADPASTVILDKANSGQFDYLVMGGFGRGSFVGALLGGVSRRMLTKSRIPLILAH